MKTNRRIVISGYYGYDNLGDEAVLQSIVQALRVEDPNVEIVVLSANPAVTAERYGVEACNRWKLPQIFSALRSADLLISGGGSLLQDVTSQMTIPYYLGIVGMARTLGKKVAFYAQGVGPIQGGFGQRLTKLIGNRVQLITVRDEESYELLKRLGVKRPRMEVMVDPVVSLKPVKPKTPEFQEIARLKERCRAEGRPLIGIAPRPWKDLQAFQQALTETAGRLQKEENAEILLIPMYAQQDLAFCEEMAAHLPGVHVMRGEYNPAELLALFQELDFMIGIRLHALIIAAVAYVPMVGITYDPKIDAFLQRLGDESIASVEELRGDELFTEVQRRLRNQSAERARIVEQMASLQAKATANARMVLDLIN